MDTLLQVMQDEKVEAERRLIARQRKCCDYCGTPFHVGHIGPGNGWGRQCLTTWENGRLWVVCSDDCADGLGGWHRNGKGRVPRLIGKENIKAILNP